MHHPWRALRGLPGVTVIWRKLPVDVYAMTNGTDRIWIDPRQSQAERRCTIAHELAHIELGHRQGCSDHDELAASLLAARRLITVQALADALVWSHDLDMVADDLWVDRDTLDVRIKHLHPSEVHHIRQRLAAREDGA